MKYKDILLAAVISFAVIGCGDSSNLQETEKSYFKTKEDEEKRKKEKEQRIASSPRNQYIFGSTLKVSIPEVFEGAYSSPRYNGIVSNSFKQTIKRIWTKLQAIGFTGFDDTVLDPTHTLNYSGHYSYPIIGDYRKLHMAKLESIGLPQSSKAFANHLIDHLVLDPDRNITHPVIYHFSPDLKDLKYTALLLGLKFNNQFFTTSPPSLRLDADSSKVVIGCIIGLTNSTTEREWFSLATDRLHTEEEWHFILEEQKRYLKLRENITPITQSQIDEWNQVFIDALAQDPFFSQFFRPQTLPDATGSVSLLAARTGKIGLDPAHLTVNGVSGSRADLGLPIFVQLKGSVDQGKSTNLTTGTAAYKLGNTLVGAIQTYSNSGTGFGIDGRQLETSVVASHSFDSFFIEGQLGSISATDVHFKNWSGSRAQLTVGVDTSWVSPFVQVSYRNLNNQSDTAVYGGLEIDLSELKADGYTLSTHLFTKAGYSNIKGTTGAVEWSGTLTLNSGLSFSTNLTLGTAAESSAGINIQFTQ